MSRINYSLFAKGIGCGIVAGMAMYYGARRMTENKCFAKRTSKMVHAFGDVVDDIQSIFK